MDSLSLLTTVTTALEKWILLPMYSSVFKLSDMTFAHWSTRQHRCTFYRFHKGCFLLSAWLFYQNNLMLFF